MILKIGILLSLCVAFSYALLREDLKFRIATGLAASGYFVLIVAFVAELRLPAVSIPALLLHSVGLILLFIFYAVQTRRTLLAYAVGLFAVLPLLFRSMHWPGAGLCMVISGPVFILFVVFELTQLKTKKRGRSGDIAFGCLNFFHFMTMVVSWVTD